MCMEREANGVEKGGGCELVRRGVFKSTVVAVLFSGDSIAEEFRGPQHKGDREMEDLFSTYKRSLGASVQKWVRC
jgi:hypothetical protein